MHVRTANSKIWAWKVEASFPSPCFGMLSVEIHKPFHVKPLLSPLHPPEGPERGRESKATQIVILIASPPCCLISCQSFFCDSACHGPFLLPPTPESALSSYLNGPHGFGAGVPTSTHFFSLPILLDTNTALQGDSQNFSLSLAAALIENLSWPFMTKE